MHGYRSASPFFCSLVAGLLSMFPDSARGQCPESRVGCSDQLVHGDGPTLRIMCNGAAASVDLTAGIVTAEVSAAAAVADAVDRFETTGASPSTPIACTIRSQLTGHLTQPGPPNGWGAIVRATLEFSQHDRTVASTFIRDAHGGPGLDVEETLDVAVTVTAGVPFTVASRIEVWWVDGREMTTVSGRLTFVDLPSGVGVRSCNGFLQPPVAVQPNTWSRVKAIYGSATGG